MKNDFLKKTNKRFYLQVIVMLTITAHQLIKSGATLRGIVRRGKCIAKGTKSVYLHTE